MRLVLTVTFSPASKIVFCLSSLWKACFQKGQFLTAQWLTTPLPTAKVVSAMWVIPQGTVQAQSRFHLVSFGLCGASLDPSQSFNHPGELENCTLGRLETQIRDDLMALPEKSNGDRRWEFYFPFGCLKGDVPNLWQGQLSPLANARLNWISTHETYFNLRCEACLLCIPAKYSWDGDNLSAIFFNFYFLSKVKNRREEFRNGPQMVTSFETLPWRLHEFSFWFCFTLNWLAQHKGWAAIPLLTHPVLGDRKNVAVAVHCSLHPLTSVLLLWDGFSE